MTKKNASRKSNDTANDNRQSHEQKPLESDKKVTVLSRQFSMEEQDSSEEKVQNLKSLNAMLVKKTVEKREQIDSLVQAKDELETELARYGMEKTDLRDELDQVSDENIGLKIELALVIDFVENRFSEMGVGVDRLMREKSHSESEIKVLKREANELMDKLGIEKEEMIKVCGERDLIKSECDLQCDEVNRLKECVIVLEKKKSNLEVMIGRLTSENDRLVKERRLSEVLIEGVKSEKIDLEKKIEDNKKEIDELQREMKVILRLKNEMETVTIDQKGEIKKLEKKIDKLNETVQSLTKEERVLRDLVVGLEKNLDESMEKEKAMILQIDALGKEKTINEAEVERLIEGKNSVEKQMEMINVQSSDKQKLIDQLSQEKIELQEGIFSREAKLVELNQKADELMRTVALLKEDCNDQTKTSDELSCKVGQLSDALAQVELKRTEADKALAEKKRHEKDLKAEVLKSEKMIEITLEKLEEIKTERESLYTSKNDLELQSETLKGEKAILEQELAELKKALDALKSELESAGLDAKHSLVMLKSAASMLSQSEYREDRFISEQQTEQNGTKSYMVELESIEKAFKNKKDIIEEMKKEAETMKQSTEELHKKQSFWTVVSSVTTIIAAASLAYAARTR